MPWYGFQHKGGRGVTDGMLDASVECMVLGSVSFYSCFCLLSKRGCIGRACVLRCPDLNGIPRLLGRNKGLWFSKEGYMRTFFPGLFSYICNYYIIGAYEYYTPDSTYISKYEYIGVDEDSTQGQPAHSYPVMLHHSFQIYCGFLIVNFGRVKRPPRFSIVEVQSCGGSAGSCQQVISWVKARQLHPAITYTLPML